MSLTAPPTTTAALSPVIRRLTLLAEMKPELAVRLEQMSRRVETHAPGSTLVKEGELGTRPRFISGGWACRQRMLPDGRRQIFNLVLPGDTLGCAKHSRLVPPTASTIALTKVSMVDASGAPDGADELQQVFELIEVRDQTLLLNHIMRLGRQTAYERTAHLLLEIGERLSLAGAGEQDRFPMPLTQEILADVLGLSVVHLNRTLQQLRRDRMIELTAGAVTLLDVKSLSRVADYTVLRQPR